jgi:hypothetical protein
MAMETGLRPVVGSMAGSAENRLSYPRQVSSYQPSDFSRKLLAHCRQWRAAAERDDPIAPVSPMWKHWIDGLHVDLRERAEYLVQRDRIRLHSHVAALHSSMAFAFNLFLPFQEKSALALAFAPLVGDFLVREVALEWIPPGALLGELAGDKPREREPATGMDAVVWGERPDGTQLAILIEVKLSEAGFTGCGGLKSRGNRRPDVCASAELFFEDPTACYLTRPWRKKRDRRYWQIFEGASGSVRAAFPGVDGGGCPFRADMQQPMRQHALALAMEAEGLVDEAWLVLVHHDDNPDVLPHWQRYAALVHNSNRIGSLPASAVVAAGESEHAEWARFMRERYALR